LTEFNKRHIFILINTEPFIQHRELIEEAGLSCSITTITRYLRTEGIEHWTALRRPKLTPKIAKIEATFMSDYKTIRKKFGVDDQLDWSDLHINEKNPMVLDPAIPAL
jgi:hypothetical protein